jgi:hypothetical protein
VEYLNITALGPNQCLRPVVFGGNGKTVVKIKDREAEEGEKIPSFPSSIPAEHFIPNHCRI